MAVTTPLRDARGALARLFCDTELSAALGHRAVRQVNLSQTRAAGTVRGLHMQHPPHAEMKLIRCLRGRVWDVAVDLRAGSPTFRQWHARELAPGSWNMMVIPEGCAHGFQALEPDCEMLYLHTAAYAPEAEIGFHHADPAFAITWPLEVTELSPRDARHGLLSPEFSGYAP